MKKLEQKSLVTFQANAGKEIVRNIPAASYSMLSICALEKKSMLSIFTLRTESASTPSIHNCIAF
jgi:hypothetical protein